MFCSLVANADILFLFCFGLFPKNSSTFAFESNGSLTISVSLSKNCMKSEEGHNQAPVATEMVLWILRANE